MAANHKGRKNKGAKHKLQKRMQKWEELKKIYSDGAEVYGRREHTIKLVLSTRKYRGATV